MMTIIERFRPVTILLSTLLLGCMAPAEDEQSEDDEEGEEDAPIDERDEGCACIVDEDPDDAPSLPYEAMAPSCGESTCPAIAVTLWGTDPGEDIELSPDDDAAVNCMLTALRDRTPGLLQWTINPTDTNDEGEHAGYILILDDGRAVTRDWQHPNRWANFEVDSRVSDAVVGALPPASEFDDCLAYEYSDDRLACVWTMEVTPTAVCDEGWALPASE